jgi:hypothetical protein
VKIVFKIHLPGGFFLAKRVRKGGDGIIKSEKPEFYYFPWMD